jgi:hypothetical protein
MTCFGLTIVCLQWSLKSLYRSSSDQSIFKETFWYMSSILLTWLSYSVGLWAGWSGVRVPTGAENFSLHHSVQTGPGAHPTSYPTGTRDSFPRDKSGEAWSWPLTSILCRGQECVELYLHSPNTPSWRGSQLKHRDNFTFTYLLTYLLTPWCSTLFEKLIVTKPLKKYPAFFMEPEGSLPFSQKPATGPNPEPAESSSPYRSLSP